MDSLAQWIAKQGGIALDGMLSGEVARVRELNKKLRGRRRVVSPTGVALDRLTVYAREAGFQVDDSTILDELERDGNALVEGQIRNRVWADYQLQDYDLDYPCEPMEPEHSHECCSVCGIETDGGLCPQCLAWASGIFTETMIRLEAKQAVLGFFETMRGVL